MNRGPGHDWERVKRLSNNKEFIDPYLDDVLFGSMHSRDAFLRPGGSVVSVSDS